MKKTLTALAIATSMVFLGAGAAQAEEYPAPPAVDAQVSEGTVVAGEPFVFSGSGFNANEEIVITISNEPSNAAAVTGGAGVGGGVGAGVTGIIIPTETFTLSTMADAEGDFAADVSLNETGTYTLTATGQESGISQSATVEVVAAAGAGAADDDGDAQASGTTGSSGTTGGLADTGLDSGAMVWAGAGILALFAGFAAVVVARRKNA